jgi:AcrR family transcriptional regulator
MKTQQGTRAENEEQIILATIECIETFGIHGATIRRIAQRAGVNSAAISYYFRSKEHLLQVAMERTLENAFDLNDFSDSVGKPVQERLTHIFSFLIEGALKFPGISRAHFYEPFIEGNYETPGVEHINAFLSALETEILASSNSYTQQEVRTKLVYLTSATMIYPGLMPKLLEPFSNVKLSDKATRDAYVENLIWTLFPASQP